MVPLTRKISNFTAGNHAAGKIPSQTPFSNGQEVAMGQNVWTGPKNLLSRYITNFFLSILGLKQDTNNEVIHIDELSFISKKINS